MDTSIHSTGDPVRQGDTFTAHIRAIEQTEGATSLADAELLFQLAGECDEGCIVEIGSSRGRSTVALALGTQGGAHLPVMYEGVRSDFDLWEPHLTEHATVAFDDAAMRDLGPYKVIQELIASDKYRMVRDGKLSVLERSTLNPT
jgi:hypothetical protein